jgi:hypothetical protein
MKTIRGDIWSLLPSYAIVVTSNVGWSTSGAGILGKGLALQAAQRFPKLAMWYGERCRETRAKTPVLVYPDGPIVMFPTKRLNEKMPWYSWRSASTIEYIEQGLGQLIQLPIHQPIAVPLLGCGAGGLTESEVVPMISRYLKDDRFTLVYPG